MVRIEELAPMRVAYMRALGPYPETFPKLWPVFMQAVMKKGLAHPDAQMLSLCHDDPATTPPAEIRGDACITLPHHEFTGDDELKVQTIPAGKFAIYTHTGSYSKLKDAWGEFFKWSKAHHYRLRPAASFEVYVNNPREVKEEELVTELYLPVYHQ